MTKTLFVGALALALSVPSTALAQRAPGAVQQRDAVTQPRAEHGIPFLRLREELQLTPQQVTQLESIASRLQAQNRPLMEQLRAAGVGHQRAGAARGQQMTPEQRQQMRQRMEQMTPEQRQQMRERMQQMTPEQRRQMHAGAGQMGQRGQQMTPEQRQQMRERMQQMTPEQRAEMRARHQGQRPEGVRRGAGVPAELQPVVAQLRQNHAAAMEAARGVLTPQQRERAEQLMRERTGQRGERAPAAHRGHR